jgi:hypothetical protein
MGNLTISMAMFHSYVKLPEGRSYIQNREWLRDGLFKTPSEWSARATAPCCPRLPLSSEDLRPARSHPLRINTLSPKIPQVFQGSFRIKNDMGTKVGHFYSQVILFWDVFCHFLSFCCCWNHQNQSLPTFLGSVRMTKRWLQWAEPHRATTGPRGTLKVHSSGQ